MANFRTLAETRQGTTAAGELWYFLKHNKTWWMLPIIVAVLGFGLLLFVSGTAATPFIYTLF